jgi:hypothetical protein
VDLSAAAATAETPAAPAAPVDAAVDPPPVADLPRATFATSTPTAPAAPVSPAAETGDTPVGLTTSPTDPRPTIGFGVGAGPTMPSNIYRARRTGVAVLLIIPAIAAGLLLIRALAISAFGRTFLIDGVIASSLALASLPLLVSGLYGLVTGAAHGAEQWGFRVWARPPLAYLLVGIAFVVAAGLAIS